jgi:hypothetical protein
MMDEAQVTFDEDEFYRKGTYNGMEVWVRKEDGYINATKIDRMFENTFHIRNGLKSSHTGRNMC